MAYTVPSLDDLSKSTRSAIKAELPATEPGLWPNNISIATKSLSPALRGLHQRIREMRGEAHVTTASVEALQRHGAELGITEEVPALANGLVRVDTDIGTFIPAGTRLLRIDGVAYFTIGDVTATEIQTFIPVAAEEAAKVANTLADVSLALESPITGVGAIVVDEDGLSGGTDGENVASYRSRVLAKKRRSGGVGAPEQYVEWGRDWGATDVFVQRATPAAGSVTVYFMMYDTYADGIPSGGDAVSLQAYLTATGRAPASAAVIVLPPTPIAIDINVFIKPDTALARDQVTKELRATFRRKAEPGTSLADFVFARAWIDEAIGAQPGLTRRRHRLDDPSDDIPCGAGEIATLGTITFLSS